MKKSFLLLSFAAWAFASMSQVTQINDNNSLQIVYPLTAAKTIFVSEIDNSIWVSNGTLAGTVMIAPGIQLEVSAGELNGKLLFRGSNGTSGSELFITDGTTAGTSIVKDINAGTAGSDPNDFTIFNGALYFSASTATQGRELWKSDGTSGGTAIVKDIVSGTGDSNDEGFYNLSNMGSYMLFAAESTGNGVELWKSDGTSGGTVLVKDIYTGSDSSSPRYFSTVNGINIFFARDATNGEELWKTDGTSGGTTLVKDINPGTGDGTGYSYEVIPGFPVTYSVFLGFHPFNNKMFFAGYDGASTGELWVTDGTTAGTSLVKNIINTTDFNYILVIDGQNVGSKFFFPVADGSSRSEIWQSDGTPGGTTLFKSFNPPDAGDLPFIYITYAFNAITGSLTQPLFEGDKFFFAAGTNTDGYELWVSDGTLANTQVVKSINPGVGSGIDRDNSISYAYTQEALFFAANDGVTGNEPWKTDGTAGNTAILKNINPAAGNSSPEFALVPSGILFFTATDGNDATNTDLFVVDGLFTPLPVKLTDFTVQPAGADALLQWHSSEESNLKNYTVQRSMDAISFSDIGQVNAKPATHNGNAYSFPDKGIMKSQSPVIYYRLAMNDRDGKSEFSDVIQLRIRNTGSWNVRLLSNPVGNDLKILFADVTTPVKLTVRDINGRTYFERTVQNANGVIVVPISLAKGTYVLSAETGTQHRTIQFIR